MLLLLVHVLSCFVLYLCGDYRRRFDAVIAFVVHEGLPAPQTYVPARLCALSPRSLPDDEIFSVPACSDEKLYSRSAWCIAAEPRSRFPKIAAAFSQILYPPPCLLLFTLEQEQSSGLFTLGVVSYCLGVALVCERLNLSHEVRQRCHACVSL